MVVLKLYSLQSSTSLYSGPLTTPLHPDLPILDNEPNTASDLNLNINITSYDLLGNVETDQLSLEIEKER